MCMNTINCYLLLIPSFTNNPISHSFPNYSLNHSFIHFLNKHSFIQSFIPFLIIHLFIHFLNKHSFIHPFIHFLNKHSSIHSLTCNTLLPSYSFVSRIASSFLVSAAKRRIPSLSKSVAIVSSTPHTASPSLPFSIQRNVLSSTSK